MAHNVDETTRFTSRETAQLQAEAATLRDLGWGNAISYSRKVFIPLTTMCRNTCGYCAFVKHPGQQGSGYLSPDEVLKIARNGERLGCKEALFSLGERPERRYPEARETLRRLGHATTIDYVIEACRLVLAHTSLIPHVNAGTLTEAEIAELREVSGSMGMMLETVSKRLMKPGMAHHACPDKSPVLRLRTIEAAGRLGVPFTTGILIGIGETFEERVESLVAIDRIHQRYGNVQEVIVQNFRAKADTAMAAWMEPSMRTCCARSPSPGWCSTRPSACRRLPTSTTASKITSPPASTTGVASLLSRSTTSTRSGRGRSCPNWPGARRRKATGWSSGLPSTRPS
ncbi:7,8-didemethyl-8-hydroxy-5-deazariboflavin synthase CofG [Mesorhizobium amorphae]|uniref:7,8-didemethyl-8-hydroxy-5-deazariboflavin synthase CofG n=1 Tax=Mesorhizobium amorphae TaxID=71433 RepID=UPI001C909C00|nr:7,8-didemethyl-8-hydroxy-5-deazariboflavin synthase CofG [Mesorhizobium amorphae]